MRRVVVVVVIGVVGWALLGCTRPNPASCADGSCSDPALPFCDVDGAIDGQPNTCVAVACAPGEVAACRGDQAVQCNAAGNNYDLVQCQLGCDVTAGGCVTCSSDQQCDNPSPVCDPGDHQCRACARDDECTSTVCDAGACVAETTIVYASPTGSNTSQCTRIEPCALPRAVTLAATAVSAPTLRLLPGLYTAGIDVSSAVTLSIVATGATLGPTSALHVSNGADVAVRGIAIRFAGDFVECVGGSAPRSALALVDSLIAVTNTTANNLNAQACTIRLVNSELTLDRTIGGSSVLGTNTDVTLEADRVRFDIANPNATDVGHVGIFGKNVSYRITNSVFDRISPSFSTSDTAGPGSQLYFAYNTFNLEGAAISCNGSTAFRDVRFENNVILGTASQDPVIGTACTLQNNILFPQVANVGGSNLLVDPQLVDVAAGDFHLMATSPAVDAAVPSAGLSTDHDFEGAPRPQGSKPDIGAFEHAP